MNKIPVVLTFDKRILMGAGVTIKTLVDAALPTTEYQIYVLHSDLSESVQNGFKKLLDSTQHKIIFKKIDNSIFTNVPKNKGSWTEVVYYKFLIPEILKDFDKAIYSDVDVFIKRDLSEVFAQDLTGFDWAGVRAELNKEPTGTHRYFPENKKDFIHMSGFAVLNLKKMRQDNFFEKVKSVISIFKSRLKFFDLDVMNLAADAIKAVPFEYVTLETIFALDNITKASEYSWLTKVYSHQELLNAKQNPAIIHYAGALGKPWHRKNPPQYYQDVIDALPRELKKLTFRDIRKRFFSKK